MTSMKNTNIKEKVLTFFNIRDNIDTDTSVKHYHFSKKQSVCTLILEIVPRNFSTNCLDGEGGEREMQEKPDVKMNTIGERMRFLREKVNLKQSAFAERVLVSESYISKVETGKEMPSDIFTKLVAYEFNVPYNWLLKGEGYPYIFQESFFSDKDNELEKVEMERYPKVGIRSKGKGGIFTEIYVDGHRIDGVRSYKMEQVAGQIARLTLDLNVINMAIDQECVLWNGLKDQEMEIAFRIGDSTRSPVFT